jgi:PKD repeat protein
MVRRAGLPGICLVILTGITGCGGGGDSRDVGPPATVPTESPPTEPIISPPGEQTNPGVLIPFSASSTDPQNEPLLYNWDFGDGVAASGAGVNHSFANAGDYTVKVTVVNEHNKTASATATIHVVAYPPLLAPTLLNTNPHHLLGEPFISDWIDDDPNGVPGYASWDFGDGTTADFVARYGGTRHVYSAPGHYKATLTIGVGSGRTASTSTDIEVAAVAPLPQLTDNHFEPYCSGAYCGAVDGATYAGHGVGVWRYHNATSAPASVDISVRGVSVGQWATLVFSNGQSLAAPSLPDPGMSPTSSPAMSPVPASQAPALIANRAQLPGELAIAAAHLSFLQRNIAFAKAQVLRRAPAATVGPNGKVRVLPRVRAVAPAVGTKAQWIDNFQTPVTYDMQVGATCALVDGRNAVVWIDSKQVASGAVSNDDAAFLAQRFCGASGIYAHETAMLGAPYGTAAATLDDFIQDSVDQLLDINIVLPGVPDHAPWGGYCNSENNRVKAADPNSNAALAIFLSGKDTAFYHGGYGPRQASTLVHELTHLINFYQRALVRGAVHAAFLEETSAMMTQDYLASSLPVYDINDDYDYTTASWVSGYTPNGAGVSYIGWDDPSGFAELSYPQGYSFGAHLHRRYGLDIDRKIFNCADQGDVQSSYQCVDVAIKQVGGAGFEDDFARMGAATLGWMPLDSLPGGFGYPPINLEGYTLSYVDNSTYQNSGLNIPPKTLTAGFLATTHTFDRQTIASGQTAYQRTNVIVPAGTTLMLVITEQRAPPASP